MDDLHNPSPDCRCDFCRDNKFDLTSTPSASGWGGGWYEGKRTKVAKEKARYKLTVKNGDSTYEFDEESRTYKYGKTDYVVEYDNAAEALLGFLEWATDEYLENKVTLTVNPNRNKK